MSPHKNASDDDDDDMFLMGGPMRPVSIYSTKLSEANLVSEEDNDDDDEDLVIRTAPVTKKRGKPAKRNRATLRENKAQTNRASKKKKISVFDIESDDDIQLVSVTPKRDVSRRDSMDNDAAAQQIAKARQLLALEANEYFISEQAEKEARQDIERTERLREEEKRRKMEEERREKEKVQAGSDARPIDLNVRYGKDKRVKMRIRMRDSVLKMLEPFCKKFGLDKDKARMEFDGEEVTQNDTPSSLELEGGEIIDVSLRK